MRRRLSASIVALSLAMAGSVAAQPGRKASADALFRDGREAVARGDFATGCPKFAESMRLDPAAGTLLNLAQCDEHAGNFTAALTKLERLSAMLQPGDDRAPLGMDQAMRLERRVGRLRVALEPGSPEGTKVLLDGAPVSLGATARVNPGKHTLVVRTPERKDRTYPIALKESETADIAVAPTPLETVSPPVGPSAPESVATPIAAAPPPATVASSTSSSRPPSTRQTAAFVTLGAGTAALIFGGVTAILATQKKRDALAHCDASHACDGEGLAAAEQFRTLSLLGTLGVGAGLVGVGVGAFLLATPSEPAPQSASIGPVLLPGGGGLGATGSF